MAPLIKIVARGDTTSVDAYLNPVLRGYVRELASRAGGTSKRTADAHVGRRAGRRGRFLGKDSILSGPAGGVVGFSKMAAAAGYRASDWLRYGGDQHGRDAV